jgi:hypothetical protein
MAEMGDLLSASLHAISADYYFLITFREWLAAAKGMISMDRII